MLDVKSLEYDSWQTIYFQRSSVIFTELLLVYSLYRYDAGAMLRSQIR